MSDLESRALRRAVAVLLLLSAARWVTSRPGPGGEVGEMRAGAGEVVAHAEAVRAAAEEGVRRGSPLLPGERIDPNRATEEELDRLPGVGPATARAIVETREAGVTFRRPEDLAAVRGIGPAAVDRIRASLDLSRPPAARGPGASRPGDPSWRDRGGSAARSARSEGNAAPVDLNRAGVDDLVRLPGIGPVLAARIAEERRRAPFASLDDLSRVPGVGPATVERLRTLAVVR